MTATAFFIGGLGNAFTVFLEAIAFTVFLEAGLAFFATGFFAAVFLVAAFATGRAVLAGAFLAGAPFEAFLVACFFIAITISYPFFKTKTFKGLSLTSISVPSSIFDVNSSLSARISAQI